MQPMAARVDASCHANRSPARPAHAPESPASATIDYAPTTQLPAPSRLRRRTVGDEQLHAHAEKRSSWISHTEPPVPAIPARFLAHSRAPSRLLSNNAASQSYNTDRQPPKGELASSPLAYNFADAASPASSAPSTRTPTPRRSLLLSPPRSDAVGLSAVFRFSSGARPAQASHSRVTSYPAFSTARPAARKPARDDTTLAALTGSSADMDMDQTPTDAQGDLFMQLAEDSTDGEPTITQRAGSRSSWADKRLPPSSPSLRPLTETKRPRTIGQLPSSRPSSRFSTHIDTSRANNNYRTAGTSFTSPRYEDGNAQLRRASRFSAAPECSPRSYTRAHDRVQSPEKSPELPTFGRRRPSFGYPSTASPHDNRRGSNYVKTADSDGDSPANSSEAKRSAAESDSVDSQTAPSTVWDELDDLKSRIKKLELTGKLPSSSSAAVAGGGSNSERPRTATTAPTTITSSPKQDRKSENDTRAGAEGPKSPAAGQISLADIHPTLHAALSKAKALLSASLYRTLEATAMDALQLAAMTGSAGPQGTTFSAASIINGVTVSDRHIRRKADLMCRNLTDLCLALCEGKHEAPSIMSSPMAAETPPKLNPLKQKYSRTSLAYGEDLSQLGNRPLSRLEARRSSILGLQPQNNHLSSPQASADDMSTSEQETTPSQPRRILDVQRPSRLSTRQAASRFERQEQAGGDEDYARPPSRAMTDVGNFRSPHHQSPREYTPASGKVTHRSPSLRESLSARRANANAPDINREIPRVASLNLDGGRRRFARESTPSVVEEDMSEQDNQSQARRRLTSLGHYTSSRRGEPSRSLSLSQRRQNVMVE